MIPSPIFGRRYLASASRGATALLTAASRQQQARNLASWRHVVKKSSGQRWQERRFLHQSRGPLRMPIKQVEVLSLLGKSKQGTVTRLLAQQGQFVTVGDLVAVVTSGSEDEAVEIRAPQSGQIASVRKHVHDAVTLGDLLLEIDTDKVDPKTQDIEKLVEHVQANNQKGSGAELVDNDWLKEHVLSLDDVDRLRHIALTLRDRIAPQLIPRSLPVWSRILELQRQNRETTPATDIAQTATDVGTTLSRLRDWNGALQQYEHALQMKVEALGDSHVDVASGHLYVGATLNHLQDFDKAIDHFLKARAIQAKELGDRHAMVAVSNHNLAATYFQKGDYATAVGHYETSLGIYQEMHGADTAHADTATSLHNLGICMKHTGDYEGAKEKCEQALEMRQQLTHSDVLAEIGGSHLSLGQLAAEMGDLPAALSHYQETLKAYEQAYGSKSPLTAVAYQNVGGIHHQLGDFDRAVQEHRNGLSILLEALPAQHPDIAVAWNNVGVSLIKRQQNDDLEQALEAHTKARSILTEACDNNPKDPRLAMTVGSIGNVFKAQGKFPEALTEYQTAHAMLEEKFAENTSSHPDIASSFNNQGLVLGELGRLDEALKCYQKARDSFAACLGEQHPHVGSCHYNMALVHQAQQDWTAALQELETAKTIWSESLGADHPHTTQVEQVIDEMTVKAAADTTKEELKQQEQ